MNLIHATCLIFIDGLLISVWC